MLETINTGGRPAYTIGQIARALDVTKQAVSKGITEAAPARSVSVEGKSAAAWLFESLPIDWQLQITRRGVKRGFENGEAFLASLPLTPWKSPRPWDLLPAKEREKAVRLQKAMARALALHGDPAMTAGQVEAAGTEDYRAEFGYTISTRHWRRLLARTLDRDGGEENWQRLDIYLDDRAFTARKVKPEALKNEYRHRALDEIWPALDNRTNPTAEDKVTIWDQAFMHYEEHVGALSGSQADNPQRRVFKRSLVEYLFRAFPAGTLCRSHGSLKRRFDEKFSEWKSGDRDPRTLVDGRRGGSGRVGKKLCAKCRPLVVGGSVDLDGDISQAWRRLQLGQQLCPECASIGSFEVRRDKSEVPKSVRRDVMPDILAALPFRRGPKHVKLISPYVRRVWSDLGPGMRAECDDVTPNHITTARVDVLTWEQGYNGRPYIGRMEVLVMIDRRTDYPWAYLIILGDPETIFTPQRKASYNSVHCRLLILHGHDQLGIPHAGGGFVLENGIWASRLIDGEQLPHWHGNSWNSVEMGLRDPRLGLDIHHAKPGNPRSKVIERMFLSIQNRSRCQPAFVGFDERRDKREAVADFIRRVKAGKEHPGNEVPSVNEFRKLLDAELMAHATEPQNGSRLPGVSPMEAFHNGIDGHPGIKEKPLRKLGENVRFLLSSHERLMRVTAQGTKFKLGGSEFVFWGPELEPFQHRKIIARINLEEPELLSCQPPNGEPFTMKARILPSSTATKEQLQEAERSRASWTRRGKVLFDTLPHPFKTTITRDNDQDQETKKFGDFYNDEVGKFKAEKTKTDRLKSKARQKAVEAGIDPNYIPMRDPGEVVDALSRLEQGWNELRSWEAQQNTQE